nr:glycosyltransferase family 2 protein [Sphingomonas xinjiangensis]
MPSDDSSSVADVTVVIAAYRATGFIRRAIDSALDQDGASIQVIVVDDCCPEGTGGFVARHYQSFDNVHVITLEVNGGPGNARNIGIRHAHGRWIAILDADDAFEQGRLARLTKAGEAARADAVADNVRYYDAINKSFSKPAIQRSNFAHEVDIYEFVDRARPGTGELDFGLLKPIFRTEAVQAMSEPYPALVRHGEDFLFYFRFILHGRKFIFAPEVGYSYTARSSGLSQTRVDYESLRLDTLRLSVAQDELGERRLAALLRKRADALDRLGRERRIMELIRKKAVAQVLASVLHHPTSAIVIAKTLKRWLLQRSL